MPNAQGRSALSIAILLTALAAIVTGCSEDAGDPDTLSAKITNDTVRVDGTEATVAWQTDVATAGGVSYRAQSGGDALTTPSVGVGTDHEVVLSDLVPETDYIFDITATTAEGVQSTREGMAFATLPTGVSTPRIIHSTVEVEDNTATIVVQANESITVKLRYGEGGALDSSTVSDKPQTRHLIILSDLTPETSYSWQVAAEDLDGNAVESEVAHFESGADGEPKVEEIHVTASRFHFSPSTIRVPLDAEVRLVLTSDDVPHGFDLDAYGVSKVIDPGAETVVEFVADEAGSFTFACSVVCGDGHDDMNGTLIVE